MPRPGTAGPTKGEFNGTNGADVMRVDSDGVYINGMTTLLDAARIAAGLTLKGNGGNDDITGGPGRDTLDGGSGDDWLRDTVDNKFIGGLGSDTVDLSSSTSGVAIDIQYKGVYWSSFQIYDMGGGYLGATFIGKETRGTLQGIENVIGTSSDDFIMANFAGNEIHGGGGNDILSAVHDDGVVDKLYGDAGNDNLAAGSGNDELTGGDGSDIFSFDPANTNGQWIIHDYTPGEDQVVLFPYSGSVSWGTQAVTGWVQVTLSGGDTITFENVFDSSAVDLIVTMSWPPSESLL